MENCKRLLPSSWSNLMMVCIIETLQRNYLTISSYTHVKSSQLPQTSIYLVTSDLTLGNRPDPAKREVDNDGNDANDPEHLAVVFAAVPEDDGKDDTTKVTGSTRAP